MPDSVARQYSWRERLHYHLNWNVSRVLIHTQAEFTHLRLTSPPVGLTLDQLDPTDPRDAALWADLVNIAYFDADAGASTLPSYWAAHPQLILKEVLVARRGDEIVATIAHGLYRADPTVGGAVRAAVLPGVQSAGLGTWLIAQAFARTRSFGATRIEGLTMVQRERSLRVQFRIGLRLQEDYSKVIPTGQLRRWPARELALNRARRVRDEFYAEHPELR